MEKQKNNDELFKSLLELNIKFAIENSNIKLNMINNKIDFYQTLINQLNENRPLFFQRKKLINYNNKFNEYYEKINNLYIELNKEINLLEKLYKQF